MRNAIKIEKRNNYEIVVNLAVTAQQARRAYRRLLRKLDGTEYWFKEPNTRVMDSWKIEKIQGIGWSISKNYYDFMDGLDYTTQIDTGTVEFWVPVAKDFRELIA